MAALRYEIGMVSDISRPEFLKALLAEFLATYVFVFASEGSVLALGKMYDYTHEVTSLSRLLGIAFANVISLSSAVSVSINISGGHVNPAVTFGALVGGRISFVRCVFYWIAQLLASVVASLFLKLVTFGMRPVGFSLAFGLEEWKALMIEMMVTFVLVYTAFATTIDPKSIKMMTLAPLAIGSIAGVNILINHSPYEVAFMNPARVFGPALVGWIWRNHWVYWVGPFVGAAVAASLYEILVMPLMLPHYVRVATHRLW